MIIDTYVKHRLKILPKYFEDVMNYTKTFEIRKDDRDFQVGDVVILQEYDNNNEQYTGRYWTGRIRYILRNCEEFGLMDGYCIIGW